MAQDDLVYAKVVTTDNISGPMTPLAAIATAGTVAIPTRAIRLSVSGGATASSLVLPNGSRDGQELTIINENATGASTLIFPSAANLPTAVTVSGANVGKRLIWSASTSIWSPL